MFGYIGYLDAEEDRNTESSLRYMHRPVASCYTVTGNGNDMKHGALVTNH